MIRTAYSFSGALAVLLVVAMPVRASDEVVAADTILAEVRARLPGQPFSVQGDLMRASLHQLPERVGAFEADLDFGSDPVVAGYVLRDRFGTAVQQLTVVRPAGEPPEFLFQSSSGAPPPGGLAESIAGTDLTWGDLSLAFLWWRGGVTVGRERILGRECYVLEYPLAARDTPAGAAVSARLWVDVKLLALLQVEERDASGARVRRVQVKDFKKIGGLWMIKNMEARSYPSKSRTIIQVRDARAFPEGTDDSGAADPGSEEAATGGLFDNE
jgi:hypothetical protein